MAEQTGKFLTELPELTTPIEDDLMYIVDDDTSKRITLKNLKSVVGGEDVTGTASGAVATFIDGGDDKPLKECEVSIEATQSGSGTPSPSNVRPIVGRSEVNVSVSGKNLWNEDYTGISANITYKAIYVGDGTFTCSTTCPMSGQAKNVFFLSGNVSSGAASATNGVSNGLPITTQSTNGYVTIAYRNDFGLNPANYETQIEIGSNATEYVPFVAHNITTIPLGRTVYGGTLDVTRGILTDEVGDLISFTSDNASVWSGVATSTQGVTRFYTTPSYVGRTLLGSDSYKISQNYNTETDIITTSVDGRIIITPTFGQGKTLEEFKALLATYPFNIKMTLATPQTYTLTPEEASTILGYNNISADSGEISVVYVRDLNITINDLINRVTALENE